MTSFLAIFGSSFALIFLWDQDSSNVSDVGSNIIILLLVFVIGFAITNEFNFFVVYLNELIPTQIRIIAMAFVKTFGGIVLMVESEIISAC